MENPERRHGAGAGASLEYRRESGQHFIHDESGNAFPFLATACREIERTGLIAADYACGLSSGACERYGEAGCARETSAARNREDHWNLGQAVESVRCSCFSAGSRLTSQISARFIR